MSCAILFASPQAAPSSLVAWSRVTAHHELANRERIRDPFCRSPSGRRASVSCSYGSSSTSGPARRARRIRYEFDGGVDRSGDARHRCGRDVRRTGAARRRSPLIWYRRDGRSPCPGRRRPGGGARRVWPGRWHPDRAGVRARAARPARSRRPVRGRATGPGPGATIRQGQVDVGEAGPPAGGGRHPGAHGRSGPSRRGSDAPLMANARPVDRRSRARSPVSPMAPASTRSTWRRSSTTQRGCPSCPVGPDCPGHAPGRRLRREEGQLALQLADLGRVPVACRESRAPPPSERVSRRSPRPGARTGTGTARPAAAGQVQVQLVGEVATDGDAANAVAARVEARREDTDPELAGTTAMIAPETPLLAGMPTANSQSPAASYMPQLVMTLSRSHGRRRRHAPAGRAG